MALTKIVHDKPCILMCHSCQSSNSCNDGILLSPKLPAKDVTVAYEIGSRAIFQTRADIPSQATYKYQFSASLLISAEAEPVLLTYIYHHYRSDMAKTVNLRQRCSSLTEMEDDEYSIGLCVRWLFHEAVSGSVSKLWLAAQPLESDSSTSDAGLTMTVPA